MIRGIIIPNLKRREDRKFAMLGHLLSPKINTPISRIGFFEAHDGQDYDSSQSVVDAAVADGFPQFAENAERFNFGKARWATDWTFCACLREIIESPWQGSDWRQEHGDPIYLLLIDDMRLQINFHHLEFVINLAKQLPGPFRAMQLFSYRWPWDIEPMTLGIDGFLQEGFGGRGDYGTILTPTGAKMLLDAHFSEPYDTLSTDFLKLARCGEIGHGFYSCRSNLVETSFWQFGNDRGE